MNLRQDADLIIRSAISSALPDAAVQSALKDLRFDQEGRIILVALGILVWRLTTIFNLFNDGQEATATITDISFYRDRGRVAYIFMFQNEKYLNSNAVMKHGKSRMLQVGEQKIVLVNRDNPKKSILKDLYL